MKYRLKVENLLWQRIDEEIVCLDLRSSKYLSINVAGRALWEQLVEGADRDELLGRLIERFDVAPERAAGDVDSFLAALTERGLLVTE